MTNLFLRSLAIGILSILIALPLLYEKIRPNSFYGFRIRATLEDPALWYAVNKHFARRLLVTGVVEVFAAVALAMIPTISPDVYTLSTLGVFALLFTVGMIQSLNYLKSLQQKENRTSASDSSAR
jgi:hypothetical protein